MIKKLKSLLFENQGVRQTILKNTFWLGFGNVAGRLIRAVVIIYAARALGASGYGAFSYALSLAAFFTVLTDIGINGIFTREAVKNPHLRSQYFSTSFAIKIVLINVSVGLIIFAAPFFTNIKEAIPLLPIMGLLLIFDSLRDFGFAFFRAQEKMQIEAGIFILTNIAVVIFSVAALFFSPSSLTLAAAYALGAGIGTAATLWLLKPEIAAFFQNFKKELIRPILTTAWPFALLGLLGAAMINTDTIMLGWLREAAEVGLYAAAQRPILLLYVLPGLIASGFFPVFSRLARSGSGRQDSENFRYLLEEALAIVAMIAVPLVFGGIILSQEIIGLIYGSQYLGAVPAFQILLFTLILVYPGTILGNAIFAYNRQKIFLVSTSLGVFGNIIFNFALIPSYGIIGSSFATIAAQILSNGYVWLKMKKINYFEIMEKTKKIVIAAFIMAVFTFWMELAGINLFINLAGSAAVYFAALYFLKEELIWEIKNILNASR